MKIHYVFFLGVLVLCSMLVPPIVSVASVPVVSTPMVGLTIQQPRINRLSTLSVDPLEQINQSEQLVDKIFSKLEDATLQGLEDTKK